MKKRTDILVDENNRLRIENGDFVVGPSDVQHVDHIITDSPGDFKQFPQLGFGVIRYLKSNVTPTRFKRNLRVQLMLDGYKNPKIDVKDGFENLKIEI